MQLPRILLAPTAAEEASGRAWLKKVLAPGMEQFLDPATVPPPAPAPEPPPVVAVAPPVPPAPAPAAAPPATPAPPPMDAPNSVAEMIQRDQNAALTAQATPPNATPAPAPAPATAPDPAPPTPKLRKVAPQPVAPAPTPVPAPVVAPVAPPPVDPLQAYVDSLDEASREEVELARFAEQKNPALKGHAEKTIKYLQQVDAKLASNPEFRPGSEDYDAFVREQQPKYPPGVRAKMERSKLTEEVAAKAKAEAIAELAPRIAAQEQAVREQQLAPVVAKTLNQFESMLTSKEFAVPGAEPVAADVLTLLKTNPDKAHEAHPVAAHIVARYATMANDYTRISRGLTQFDVNNPNHAKLHQFLQRQGEIYAASPQSRANGLTFLPIDAFNRAVAANPEVAKTHYTFSPDNVLAVLSIGANQEVAAEENRLAKAGYVRQAAKPVDNRPVATATPAPPAAPAAVPARQPSARVTTGAQPGLAESTPPVLLTPGEQMLKRFYPVFAQK